MPPSAPGFGSMKARTLIRLLERELGYRVVRQNGSHRTMKAPDRPKILFAFHDGDEVGPALVRSILVQQAGLTLSEAREVAARA